MTRIMMVWARPRHSTSEQFRTRLGFGKIQPRVVAIEHDVPTEWGRKRRGRELLRGLWYGDGDPHNPKNFGKTEGSVGFPIGKVVGKRVSPFLKRRMKD